MPEMDLVPASKYKLVETKSCVSDLLSMMLSMENSWMTNLASLLMDLTNNG
jgi:hypothetical protein